MLTIKHCSPSEWFGPPRSNKKINPIPTIITLDKLYFLNNIKDSTLTNVILRKKVEIDSTINQLKRKNVPEQEIYDSIKKRYILKLEQKLDDYFDQQPSILYLLFPQKTIKWKEYIVKGSLQNMFLGGVLNRLGRVESEKPFGYQLERIQNLLTPNMVRLNLSSPDFEIKLISTDWQSMNSNNFCDWFWEIAPKERDKEAKLHFVLEGKNKLGEVFPIGNFTKNVTISGGFGKDIAKNWQWIVATIIIPTFTWLVAKGKLKKMWAFLMRLFKRTKVVKVEEVQKEKEGEGRK